MSAIEESKNNYSQYTRSFLFIVNDHDMNERSVADQSITFYEAKL